MSVTDENVNVSGSHSGLNECVHLRYRRAGPEMNLDQLPNHQLPSVAGAKFRIAEQIAQARLAGGGDHRIHVGGNGGVGPGRRCDADVDGS